ncbi:bifunctional GTP diphosphokinase/guanosine-3',5'-bis pyrophosphate 3'-pyrophosphohydrolase [Treponema sp.]
MNRLISSFAATLANYTPDEQERIKEASLWADELHQDQRRASGEPYLIHPLGVASILMELKMDADTVVAALLHDSIEDTSATQGILETRFGKDVALMVDGVTKIADLSAKNKTVQEAESIRKMLFAMAKDIRVILIKLADKLHNMRTLEFLEPDRRKAIAQECLDIYAPLADRLGISWMKDELEDLSLKHLNRDVFDQIKGIVALKKGERAEYLQRVQDAIYKEAASTGISITVNARAKHFYSIYQKMRKRDKGAEELYDLLGIRILCDDSDSCYTLLGAVHRLWKPIDGRFKDYIAMPKANGYRSLHTTVMCFEGKLIEIQIRTREMHRIAEYGVASHWLYKKGSTSEIVRVDDLSIVNRLKDWNRQENEEGTRSGTFLDDIKKELLKDSIFVFTPQGKVIELPAGSTPIDFAYQIHSAIGDRCAGAKADGAIIPLSGELKNTQVVEILTSQNARPHLNWLRFVRTAKARNRIRSWLQLNDDSLIFEKNVVAKKKTQGLSHIVPQAAPKDPDSIQRVLHGNVASPALQVRVQDERNMMIRFALCCRPVTGDPIIGYVSRGRGIIIHRKTCKNVALIPDFEERKMVVEWENESSHLIKRFRVEAKYSTDLFSEIEGAVRKNQGHLIEGRLEETASNRLTGFFTMELDDKDDLKKVLKNLRGIPSVLSILTIN